jgi:hypothetical protein
MQHVGFIILKSMFVSIDPVAGAAGYNASVYWRSVVVVAFSNPADCMDICVLRVLCFVSATGRVLVHRSPIECDVSECDREATIERRLWATRSCCAMKGKIQRILNCEHEHEPVGSGLRGNL